MGCFDGRRMWIYGWACRGGYCGYAGEGDGLLDGGEEDGRFDGEDDAGMIAHDIDAAAVGSKDRGLRVRWRRRRSAKPWYRGWAGSSPS
jgi:hypothetical protein